MRYSISNVSIVREFNKNPFIFKVDFPIVDNPRVLLPKGLVDTLLKTDYSKLPRRRPKPFFVLVDYGEDKVKSFSFDDVFAEDHLQEIIFSLELGYGAKIDVSISKDSLIGKLNNRTYDAEAAEDMFWRSLNFQAETVWSGEFGGVELHTLRKEGDSKPGLYVVPDFLKPLIARSMASTFIPMDWLK